MERKDSNLVGSTTIALMLVFGALSVIALYNVSDQ